MKPERAKGLPAAWETERAILGGLLLDPSRLPAIREILEPEHFHRPHHVALYVHLCRMADRGETPDVLTVIDDLERADRLESVGGASYVLAAPAACVAIENLPSHARKVRDLAIRRKVALTGQALIERVQGGEASAAELLEHAERSIAGIERPAERPTWHAFGDVLDEEVRAGMKRTEAPGDVVGVPTGWHDLDRRLAGLQRTDLIILAGRPSMGKTAAALGLAEYAARSGVGVGFFSLEMSRRQLVSRVLVSRAGVDAGRWRTGRIDPTGDVPRILEATDALMRLPLWIDDERNRTISSLSRAARRMKAEHPEIGLFVLDYLQLVGSEKGQRDRGEAIAGISRGLKILAGDLDVPFVALSQLNRGLEARQDKRPMLSDLRDSGAIEQDADVVLFLYRDEVYNDASPDRGIAEVIIAKQRSGSLGKTRLGWIGASTSFVNLSTDGPPAQQTLPGTPPPDTRRRGGKATPAPKPDPGWTGEPDLDEVPADDRWGPPP